MTLTDLASLGSFISGIAVVVSFVFLGLQLRQANKNQRALMQQGRTTRFMQNFSLMADPYISSLVGRVATSDTNFTAAEVSSLTRMHGSWFWSFEDTFLQHRAGMIDDASWLPDLAALKMLAADLGCRVSWRMLRSYTDGPYAEFIDQLVREATPQPVPDWAAAWKSMMTEERAALSQAPQERTP
jgi:hypothetical protein